VRAVLLAAVLVAGALAGCSGAHRPTPTSSSSLSTSTAPPPFDGAAALAFAKGLATHADGTPRYRIPGTAGQADGAAVLWRALDVPGWTRSFQNFTGQDYLALNRSAVAGYTEPDPRNDPPGGGSPRGCTPAEHDGVPGLRFANLLAVHAGPAGSPLLLLGAHWDSQMHSDFDPDPAKRDSPDPGANDGASGVGVLLQLMRALPAHLPFGVGVLLIDGEDGFYDCYPDAGSLMYAQHPLGNASAAAFVLLDMVGDAGARFPRETHSVHSAPNLVSLLWRHGSQAAPGHFLDDPATIADDHLAFIQEGVPAVDVVDAGHPDTRSGAFPAQWDTTGDTVDKLDAATLGAVGDVLVATLKDPEFAASFAPE